MKWAYRFLDLARHVAEWSKDPTTKVGAVATDPDSLHIITTGYNGIPRGVVDRADRMERPAKYLFTAHAEANLVAHAARTVLEGKDVTVTHFCCADCAKLLINAGVKRIYVGAGTTSMPQEHFDASRTMLAEAGVEVIKL
jgi:dCMP deaminase